MKTLTRINAKAVYVQAAVVVFVMWLTIPISTCEALEPADRFFETKIRPLLIERCITCHADDEPEGGLSLESSQGWAGRAVIVPGKPQESLLIAAVRWTDPTLQMPPADSGAERLSENEIQDLETWIRTGAFDPRTGDAEPTAEPKRRTRQFRITDQDLKHWAYQPIDAIAFQHSDSSASAAIDRLIDDQLQPLGIVRSAQASPRELVRRAYFDLWGLPPEPDVVAEFQRDPSDAAWQAMIERLLASPYYGQRWGRYWLDWVRFAETNGYERDGLKPNAWRYRDYVIESFSSDKPYDRFLIEQLAGDQLIVAENLTLRQTPELWKDAVIATGYYRLHVWDDEPDSSEAAELDELDDVMVTTGAAIMGMTLGCARCHDHKFDPVSQVDYYSMLQLLRDIDPYGLHKKGGGGRGTGRIERFLCSDEQVDQWRLDQRLSIAELETKLASADEPERGELAVRVKQLQEVQPPFDKALAINPPPDGPKTTFVLTRGDYQSPAEQVSAAIPQLFVSLRQSPAQRIAADNPTGLESRVREEDLQQVSTRLELARWLTHPEHPLTARVLANRIWQNHFGAGIVPTADDFGYTGVAPKNIKLLDYLSAKLVHGGWSIKSLHRTIMNSQAYRMSSNARPTDNYVAHNKDPDNNLFWRQNLRRLDAEAIRDSMLVYAGQLSGKNSGPSIYSTLSAEIRETANPVSLTNWETSPEDQQYCRSVFLIVKRSLKEPLLELFDFANSHTPVGQRPVTTVAPQALMMLNDRFVHQRSEKLAERITTHSLDTRLRLERLWQIVYQRNPSKHETTESLEFIQSQTSEGRTEQNIWTSLARAVLNSSESIYMD